MDYLEITSADYLGIITADYLGLPIADSVLQTTRSNIILSI